MTQNDLSIIQPIVEKYYHSFSAKTYGIEIMTTIF